MKIYENYVNDLKRFLFEKNENRFFAQQLLRLHNEAAKRIDPLIVELGVDKGQSTRVFLNAIENKEKAKLISIDIRDCSDAAHSQKWDFVQQDSTDLDNLLNSKPEIKHGIDILYVDSLHKDKHVKKEIYLFFRYIKKGGIIFFDDIDSTPYMSKQRKDSVSIEIANRKIYQLLEAIFRANMDKIDFEIMRGSTGLAIFKKDCNLGIQLNEPKYISERKFNYKIFQKLLSKKFLK